MEKIRYGLKLWSDNIDLVADVVAAHRDGHFDFVELYSNPAREPDYSALEAMKTVPVTIHATHSHGFHEFIIGDEQRKIWRQTIALADFFKSPIIVLHPGRLHTIESFKENLAKIDDSRIHIENMAGRDLNNDPMFGQDMSDLLQLKNIKPICFDLEKAIKAACYQNIDYKKYIGEALLKLKPEYFHISGGDCTSPVDQHLDLAEANFDLRWIKNALNALPRCSIVFETPKKDGLVNDLENMAYFRGL